jgi:pyruvate/2-oxoglutarate dehydrogenase complex dihydrolipoamide dehydrogenase (E3) component
VPEQVDVVVVGAGQGGVPIAKAFADAGKRAVLVESTHVGGSCVNVGCTPTKTMVASARTAYLARRSADYGVHTGEVSVDLAFVRERKRRLVDEFRTGSERQVAESPGLELIMGEASFVEGKTLTVAVNGGGRRELTAETVIVDVGTRPAELTVPGADTVEVLNSTTIMELAEVPRHLVVVGGGPIGLEFGQMFRRFGSEVTIVHRSELVMEREDPEICEAISTVFRRDGIALELSTQVESLSSRGDEIEAVLMLKDGTTRTVVCSHVLNATGRTSNADRLKVERAGLEVNEKGYIPVDEKLRTNVDGIYAIGDVNGGPAYTHISYDDFRILEANLLKGGDRSTKDRYAPFGVFIDPEYARVGLTEAEAKKLDIPIKVASLEMSGVARAMEMADTVGLMRGVVHAETGQIRASRSSGSSAPRSRCRSSSR